MTSRESHDSWPTKPPHPTPAPSAPPLPDDPGPKFGDRLGSYQLLARLGQGGMGMVFRALHVHLKKEFALKVLSPHWACDPEVICRFQRETEALGRLEHANLVRASDAGVEGGTPFVVMELLDGMDLGQLTKQRGPWPVAEACEAIRQAALGLQHAHERGLVHRDIKPSNLWLTPDSIVKVLDLGLARLCDDNGGAAPMTVAGAYMGTPDYNAPEQILDSHSADIRADLYSLGCTLFQFLIGEPPFGNSTHPALRQKSEAHLQEPPPAVRQRRPDVPAELATLLARLLAKRPEERYQTPAEVAAALTPFTGGARLESLLGGSDVSATPSVSTGSLKSTLSFRTALSPVAANRQRFVRQRPWLTATAVAVGLTAVALLLLAFGRTPHEQASLSPPGTEEPPGGGARKPLDMVQVMKLDVTLNRAVDGVPGVLGEDAFVGHADDIVKVEARLSRPAYAFLIAFRPDGKADVCFPEKEDEAPPMADKLGYPMPPKGGGYGLNDGTGLEAFALVVSSQPLPAFREWWPHRQGCPWKKEEAFPRLVYRANGEDKVELLVAGDAEDPRGKGAKVKGETPMADLALWLRKTPGIETVQVLGFAVMPKEKR